jgi:hypothetical protein
MCLQGSFRIYVQAPSFDLHRPILRYTIGIEVGNIAPKCNSVTVHIIALVQISEACINHDLATSMKKLIFDAVSEKNANFFFCMTLNYLYGNVSREITGTNNNTVSTNVGANF